MRQAKKERKKFQSRIPFVLDPGKKIPIKMAKQFKKSKNLIPALFLSNKGRERPRKRKKKKFAPNSVHTRPVEENSEKNSKKIEKIKKPLSSIIYSQNWMKQAEKEKKKNFVPNSIHTRTRQENSEKSRLKKSKN